MNEQTKIEDQQTLLEYVRLVASKVNHSCFAFLMLSGNQVDSLEAPHQMRLGCDFGIHNGNETREY